MLRLHHFRLPVIAALLAALLLAGCGKKGPLYLPDNPPKPDHKQPKS
jgi:predicted small lipoprotein YifL